MAEAFDYKNIIQRAIGQPFFDTAPSPWSELLQIKVEPANVPAGQSYWRAICGYHLPDSGGNPNIYLAAVDQQGQVIHNTIKFGWTWEGRRPNERADPVRGDKPPNEPPANINLGKYQIVTVWVDDVFDSDRVYNLRSDWPGALFHTATFVAWQLSVKGDAPKPPEPDPAPADEFTAGYKLALRRAIEAIEALEG